MINVKGGASVAKSSYEGPLNQATARLRTFVQTNIPAAAESKSKWTKEKAAQLYVPTGGTSAAETVAVWWQAFRPHMEKSLPKEQLEVYDSDRDLRCLTWLALGWEGQEDYAGEQNPLSAEGLKKAVEGLAPQVKEYSDIDTFRSNPSYKSGTSASGTSSGTSPSGSVPAITPRGRGRR